jgi:hypothetical protein
MAEPQERPSLDALGVLQGTDKSLLGQGYLRHYDRAFSPMRDLPINIIEIGVADGGSVRTWERYFSQARIVGIDINERCKRFATDRVTVEIGSQADVDFLIEVADRFPPTLVIDDGSHQADHILVTLECLFPKILPGGCHVIEDLGFHAGVTAAAMRGSAEAAPQNHVAEIVQHLLNVHISANSLTGIGRKLCHQVDRVEVITGAVLIWKKETRAPNFDLWEKLVEHSASAANWNLFTGYVLRQGESKDRAIAAVNRAIGLQPTEAVYRERLSQIHERFGDLRSAVDAQMEAVRLAPRRESMIKRLAALQAATG